VYVDGYNLYYGGRTSTSLAHLLLDVLEARVDAAVVISNDADLKFPVSEARLRVPVGIVIPGSGCPALGGRTSDGVGGHWWRSLKRADCEDHQLPNPVGRYWTPVGW
jgi:hypothetical protein